MSSNHFTAASAVLPLVAPSPRQLCVRLPPCTQLIFKFARLLRFGGEASVSLRPSLHRPRVFLVGEVSVSSFWPHATRITPVIVLNSSASSPCHLRCAVLGRPGSFAWRSSRGSHVRFEAGELLLRLHAVRLEFRFIGARACFSSPTAFVSSERSWWSRSSSATCCAQGEAARVRSGTSSPERLGRRERVSVRRPGARPASASS